MIPRKSSTGPLPGRRTGGVGFPDCGVTEGEGKGLSEEEGKGLLFSYMSQLAIPASYGGHHHVNHW